MYEIIKHRVNGLVIDEILVTRGDLTLRLLNYGAAIKQIKFKRTNIVMSYNDVASYVNDNMYLGKSVGRFAGRIQGGKYQIDGKNYQLALNDGNRTLHGGKNSIAETTFLYKITEESSKTCIVFSKFIPKDKNGFNSTINLLITYCLHNSGKIIVKYQYKTSEKTIVNYTNHSYFTLDFEPTINNLLISLNSNYLYEQDDLVPNGNIIPSLKYTDVALEKVIKDFKGNLDNTFILNSNYVCTLKNPSKSIKMDVFTSYPCCVIYGCAYPRDVLLSNGQKMSKYGAITLECQYAPNEINFKNTPIKCICLPDKWYSNYIEYRFSMI